MIPRPHGVSKRDLLIGLMTVALVEAKVPDALDIAANACAPLFEAFPPGTRWYPIIDPTHAKISMIYAGRAFRYGALSKEEYDWICDKCRKAMLKPVPARVARVALPMEYDDGPQAA